MNTTSLFGSALLALATSLTVGCAVTGETPAAQGGWEHAVTNPSPVVASSPPTPCEAAKDRVREAEIFHTMWIIRPCTVACLKKKGIDIEKEGGKSFCPMRH